MRSEIDELDLENEGGVGRDDIASTLGAVGVVRRAGEDGLLSLTELENALVPAADDLLDTNDELEGLSAGDAGVEHGAVSEFAGVVNLDLHALNRIGSDTFVELLDCERHICG